MYDENSMVDWYVAFRAYEAFASQYSRYPQTSDMAEFQRIAFQWSSEIDGLEIKDGLLREFIRYDNCEIHVTEAFIGGVASQEAVKLITKQYTPINNTFVHTFNTTVGQVLEA